MAPTPRLATITSLALLALSPLAVSASPTHPTRATETDGFYNPTDGGGKWLTDAIGTYPAGLGEPINGVLSSDSDAYVLTNAGFLDWGVSVGYGGSCLGQMGGNPQAANLGDGNGVVNQTDLLRWDYGDPVLGTCTETVKGGSHYRYWVQNGTAANSGAYFMALSYEKNLTLQHDIVDDGYNVGRDLFVGNATVAGGTTSSITGKIYTTTSVLRAGYLAANSSVGVNHGIAQDGMVAVFTVKVTGGSSSTSAAGAKSTSSSAMKMGMSIVGAVAVVGAGLMTLVVV